jgi:hypothetical protein
MEQWTSYTSQTEKFSTSFPQSVTRQFLGYFGDDGKSPATVVFTSKTADGALYEVRVTRVMQYFGLSGDFLETVLYEMAKTIRGASIVERKAGEFQGRPAIYFGLSIRASFFGLLGASRTMRGVIALEGNSVYIVSVVSPSGSAHDESDFLARFTFAASL